MKGFIKKDLLQIKNNLKTMLILLTLYFVLALNGDTSLVFLPNLLSIILSLATFSYDSYNKWDSYAITLPKARENVVKAKYLVAMIILLIFSVLILGITLGIYFFKPNMWDIKEVLLSLVSSSAVTLVLISIIYPLIFKWGVEKARIMIFVLVFGIAFGAMAIFQVINFSIPKEVSGFLIKNAVLLVIVGLALIVFISYKISKKIYSKKEF